jgi:hypothetical protein
MKVIRAPIREEYIVVRKGLRLLEGRSKIAVRENGGNCSLHPAITDNAPEDVSRMSCSAHADKPGFIV